MRDIKFNDKWFDDEEVVLDARDIESIEKDETTGLYIIENVDGFKFACSEYEEV